MFYLGLMLIVLGTGLLKPNISVVVGQLYAQKDVRRDAAFSLFYMGINLGAFLGPLVTGYLAQNEGFRAQLTSWGMNPNSAWHWGFGAAGVGMTLGLIQYVLGSRALGAAGLNTVSTGSPEKDAQLKSRALMSLGIGVAVLVLFGAGVATGILPFTVEQIVGAYTYVLFGITIAFFAWLFAQKWTDDERKRLYLIVVFFIAAAMFWGVFEQAGSTLSLFARDSTRNFVFGWEFPSQLVAVAERDVHLHPGAGLCVALGQDGQQPAVDTHQIRARSHRRRRRIPHPGARRADGDGRRQGWCRLAVHGLPRPYAGRAVPQPGRAQRDDQARTRAYRQPDDGRLVPRRVHRQLPRQVRPRRSTRRWNCRRC